MLPSGKQLGGAPANFAYHAQALGAQSFVISCIGKDRLGSEIIARFHEIKLGQQYIDVDVQHPTGCVTVRLDSSGKPTYAIHENVAWDNISFNDELSTLAARVDAVCFGSLAQRSLVSRTAILEFLKNTRPQCLRVFDINLRQAYYTEEVIAESLSYANVLKLNDEELPVVAEMLDINGSQLEIVQALMERFSLRALALTRGANGSMLCMDHVCVERPSFKVMSIADTVGAGDAFTAALTVGLLDGKNPNQICEYANLLASYICSQHGAMPPISEKYPKLY